MIETPQVVQAQTQPAAVIKLVIPRAEIQKVMGPAMAEVVAFVTAQGQAPAGAVFAHHFRMNSDTFDFEVGVPVSSPIQPAGRVEAGELPAARVARTIYRGPYEGLGSAWREFSDWLTAHGHKPAGDLWECYVAGPDSSPDPDDWRTELNRPLVS